MSGGARGWSTSRTRDREGGGFQREVLKPDGCGILERGGGRTEGQGPQEEGFRQIQNNRREFGKPKVGGRERNEAAVPETRVARQYPSNYTYT